MEIHIELLKRFAFRSSIFTEKIDLYESGLALWDCETD